MKYRTDPNPAICQRRLIRHCHESRCRLHLRLSVGLSIYTPCLPRFLLSSESVWNQFQVRDNPRGSFIQRASHKHSLPFRSLIGLFTGDSASPTLWNIYFADFQLPPHEDDVRLNGRPVSQAEQADDNLIMSTSFPAFQAKVTMFFVWGTNKRTFVSAKKSKWMIFGPLPAVIPVLRIGNLVVDLRPRLAKQGIQLYMAWVDCYLISGCELSLDTAGGLLDDHVDVQHTFLRRLLSLNSHSMLAILFTETGQTPLRVRRLLLALGRLRYMVMVDAGRSFTMLCSIPSPCCAKGSPAGPPISCMLRRLPTPIEVEADDLLSVDSITAIEKRVVAILDDDLQRDIDRLVKTHLLRNRLEMGDEKSLVLATRRMRHYPTMVIVPAHRKALTGLLLGDHPLSVERLRLCRGAVEDEAHALFDCVLNRRLVRIREEFLQNLADCDPDLHTFHAQISSYDFLLRLVSSRKAVKVFAKFVFQALALFQELPRYSPVVFRNP
ncbi:hypothetical protein C8R46DRAFT_1253308 [Mycena filopes]|nr:hypothetical protein C8R46DRAFT_1253308 [Mycena filopes]